MPEVAAREAILGTGAGGPLSAPSPWIQFADYLYYGGGVVVGNPTGGFKGVGTLNLQSLYINGTLTNLSQYVLLAGSVMTGFLTLSGLPTSDFHAAPKKYIDDAVTVINATIVTYLPKAGGTMTGAITLSGAPTVDLHAATKKYVDDKFTGMIQINDAPSDGTTYGRKNAAWVDTSIIDMGTY